MGSVQEHGGRRKKAKRGASRHYRRGGLSGTCYIRREEDWYPPDCSLVDPNIEKRHATQRELIGHCERLTCPVCARYSLQRCISSIQKTHAIWSFPRYSLTCDFEPVRRSQLSEIVITRVVICAERVVRYLHYHKGIINPPRGYGPMQRI